MTARATRLTTSRSVGRNWHAPVGPDDHGPDDDVPTISSNFSPISCSWRFRERLFPDRENDRVLARGVVLVHQHEALQRACERLGVARPDHTFAGDGQYIFGHLPAAVMLRLEHIGVSRRRPARLFDGREDVGFLELALVVVLTEAAEQLGRARKRISRE